MDQEILLKFVGHWKKKSASSLPDNFSEFHISGDLQSGFAIQWAKGEATSFDRSEVREVKDAEGIRNTQVSECQIFASDSTVVRSTVWKSLEGSKGIASILTTFRLINDSEIKFNKYGYTAFKDSGLFQVQSYQDLAPFKFECDYVKQ